jgi:hypothetical protein
MSTTDLSKSPNMTPHRLESLTDGIFAFAMTLFSPWLIKQLAQTLSIRY